MTGAARHYVDGGWRVDGDVRPTFDVYSGRECGAYHAADEALAEEAVLAARRTFERTNWGHSPRLRAQVLLELAEAIAARAGEIARAIAVENGKILSHCSHETNAAISEARYYAGLARSIFGRVTEVDEGKQSIFSREPIGVAAIIVPWNAPSTLLLRSLGPALAAGCTVVIKGAHQTSTVNRIFAECLAACPSLLPGAVNVVHGEIEVARLLCTHIEVDTVSFTGSSATGKAIMAGAAPTLKRLSLELGGKAPALVFGDTDIDRAVREILTGAIAHAGQMCTAVARVLVEDSAWHRFVPRLVEAAKGVSVGDPVAAETRMGPLFDLPSAERYQANLDTAAQAGSTLLKGEIVDGHPRGNVVTPALYEIEDQSQRLVQDELFAPILMVERFSSDEAAVLSANATRYGLAASVFTENQARARRVARALKSGTVWINCHNRLFAEAETGGFRDSGLGRLHGLEGLSPFLETKHVYAEFGRLDTG